MHHGKNRGFFWGNSSKYTSGSGLKLGPGR